MKKRAAANFKEPGRNCAITWESQIKILEKSKENDVYK